MGPHARVQRHLVPMSRAKIAEGLITVAALVRLLVGMSSLMAFQLTRCYKVFVTLFAHKRFVLFMATSVHIKAARHVKLSVTFVALEFGRPAVFPCVTLQVLSVAARHAAYGAGERVFAAVFPHMVF